MLSLSFIKEIEKIIGRENVLTGEADRQSYAYDAAVLPPVDPRALCVRPTRRRTSSGRWSRNAATRKASP